MQEESIYNLLPREEAKPAKQSLYKSRFYHSIPPTGSTFGHHTTSVPKISNLHGEVERTKGGHCHTADGATFGKAKGTVKPDPKTFTKKGTGKMGSSHLPQITGLSSSKYDKTNRKPAIPNKGEKPIMGLITSKNYILANKVENMLSQPKIEEQPIDWTKKKNYGATPKYLDRIKEQVQREYEHVKSLQQQEQEQHDSEKFVLSEEEIQGLRDGLKRKWEIVNKDYQLLTHKTVMDTIGLRRRKENCEKELMQLERDMEKLHKGMIYVDATH